MKKTLSGYDQLEVRLNDGWYAIQENQEFQLNKKLIFFILYPQKTLVGYDRCVSKKYERGYILDTSYKIALKKILSIIESEGLIWKPGKLDYHLKKRKSRNHINDNLSKEGFNDMILERLFNPENGLYLYILEYFEQNYYVFTDGKWIIIIGENAVMETAFPHKNVETYLTEEKGYYYIGKLKEVFH